MLSLGALDLTSVSIAVGIAGGLITAGVGVFEYRLKTRAQTAEIDVTLARLFSELVPIANGRGGEVVAEAAVAAVAASRVDFTAKELDDRCVVTLVVGEVTQASAIVSLGYLGRKYEELYLPARTALDGLAYVRSSPRLAAARQLALDALGSASHRDRSLPG